MVQKKRVRFHIENTEGAACCCDKFSIRMLLRPRKLFQMLVGTSVALAYIQFQLLSVTERRLLTQSISSALGIETRHFLKSTCKDLPRLLGFENVSTRSINDVEGLNRFSWENLKGKGIDSMLLHETFPKKPNSTRIIKISKAFLQEANIGLWMFGYIIPGVSGSYKFAIASDDSSELWLSNNENPKSASKIASVEDFTTEAWTLAGEYTKYSSQISEEIFLKKCQPYFVEILLKQSRADGFVEVAWKLPKTSAFNFEVIYGDFLLPFAQIGDVANNTGEVDLPNESRELLWTRHLRRKDRLIKVKRFKNPKSRDEELEGLVEKVVEKDF